MTQMTIVEKWCKQRHYCWSLPISAFYDAILYDNWFRHTCATESYKTITSRKSQGLKSVVQPPHGETYFTRPFCTSQEKLKHKEEVEQEEIIEINSLHMICLKLKNGDVCEYTFDRLDFNWTYNGFDGKQSICYDFFQVCKDIALQQVNVLKGTFRKHNKSWNLGSGVWNLIAEMIVERFSIQDEKTDSDDEHCYKLPLPQMPLKLRRRKRNSINKKKYATKRMKKLND